MESALPLTARTKLRVPWVAACVGSALLALFLSLGLFLSRAPLPMPVVLGFGIGLLGTLALALTRYDAAVGL